MNIGAVDLNLRSSGVSSWRGRSSGVSRWRGRTRCSSVELGWTHISRCIALHLHFWFGYFYFLAMSQLRLKGCSPPRSAPILSPFRLSQQAFLDPFGGFQSISQSLDDVAVDSNDSLFLDDLMNSDLDATETDLDQQVPREINLKGLRSLPHPLLHAASEGKEKLRSDNNNRWALKKVDELRKALGWDMRIPFGDLPLADVDYILAEFFSRVTKRNGEDFPAESLSNLLGGYNRILRHASNLRALKGIGQPLGRDFCIKKHPQFVKTRLVVDAAVKKTTADGTNKKRKKVSILTECHEIAVLADVDHQVYHVEGCQKRVVFYLLCRCGIRGGGELWELKRVDLTIMTDRHGKEFVRFEERHSKNNGYDVNHTKEEQMRETYHSYEPDFIFSVKQYLRHLPVLAEGVTDTLFPRPIQHPIGIIWYNRVFKVSKDKCAGYMRNMLSLVKVPNDMIVNNVSNKSGRATLITRMCAKGVPDLIGMLVSGHHTQDGYQRYDRTKDLKMKAAIEAVNNPGMNYQTALANVSKQYYQDEVVGTFEGLQPLIQRLGEGSSSASSMIPDEVGVQQIEMPRVEEIQEPTIKLPQQELAPKDDARAEDLPKKVSHWNDQDDGIDWELAVQQLDPVVRKALGAMGGFPQGGARVASGSSGSGSTFSGNFAGCTINIFPNLPKENTAPPQ